ncbi:sporulation-specific protein 15 [Aplysia californica]|uniref:Sporulation-specific protein 15 n=1 Tax=Aplysia californica TaxID=6500 RepID=A0ABM0K4U7_APLCA|nr:sporulation-specific protein 15 [Aplysia californica]
MGDDFGHSQTQYGARGENGKFQRNVLELVETLIRNEQTQNEKVKKLERDVTCLKDGASKSEAIPGVEKDVDEESSRRGGVADGKDIPESESEIAIYSDGAAIEEEKAEEVGKSDISELHTQDGPVMKEEKGNRGISVLHTRSLFTVHSILRQLEARLSKAESKLDKLSESLETLRSTSSESSDDAPGQRSQQPCFCRQGHISQGPLLAHKREIYGTISAVSDSVDRLWREIGDNLKTVVTDMNNTFDQQSLRIDRLENVTEKLGDSFTDLQDGIEEKLKAYTIKFNEFENSPNVSENGARNSPGVKPGESYRTEKCCEETVQKLRNELDTRLTLTNISSLLSPVLLNNSECCQQQDEKVSKGVLDVLKDQGIEERLEELENKFRKVDKTVSDSGKSNVETFSSKDNGSAESAGDDDVINILSSLASSKDGDSDSGVNRKGTLSEIKSSILRELSEYFGNHTCSDLSKLRDTVISELSRMSNRVHALDCKGRNVFSPNKSRDQSGNVQGVTSEDEGSAEGCESVFAKLGNLEKTQRESKSKIRDVEDIVANQTLGSVVRSLVFEQLGEDVEDLKNSKGVVDDRLEYLTNQIGLIREDNSNNQNMSKAVTERLEGCEDARKELPVLSTRLERIEGQFNRIENETRGFDDEIGFMNERLLNIESHQEKDISDIDTFSNSNTEKYNKENANEAIVNRNSSKCDCEHIVEKFLARFSEEVWPSLELYVDNTMGNVSGLLAQDRERERALSRRLEAMHDNASSVLDDLKESFSGLDKKIWNLSSALDDTKKKIPPKLIVESSAALLDPNSFNRPVRINFLQRFTSSPHVFAALSGLATTALRADLFLGFHIRYVRDVTPTGFTVRVNNGKEKGYAAYQWIQVEWFAIGY